MTTTMMMVEMTIRKLARRSGQAHSEPAQIKQKDPAEPNRKLAVGAETLNTTSKQANTHTHTYRQTTKPKYIISGQAMR